ncbi:heptaprenyl diphosphate synthase [Paenibacillus turicensis]|uniref:Heptaprenyl diphosphate synthase n=1 Tax=Paenibacillus turicensis TaxID=160487 RepID=A0ABS4FY31_9BACL|nr:polyprenyl synthetase family protein [Paenibacillus turicensis]MBP1907488.1 heptaprenyl diphosphate synthase [Paenibacillus turicensis]
MKLVDIFGTLKRDIDFIERQLYKSIEGDDPLLSETSLHLLKAGGKRLRPVFVLLGAKFGEYDINKLQYIAVPLELIHSASLVHDDVIDDAALRRGKPTVKSKWDNKIAMYTGDYIYAKALMLVTELKNPDIHRILAKALVQMSIGEMEQIRDFYNTNQSVRNYLLRIRRKTALLIAISCQLGAIAAGVSKEHSRLLYQYGYNVGMAFQIRDDLLDLCGTEKAIGKPPGSDMRQGNITLPVIYTLQHSSNKEKLLAEIDTIRHQADGDKDTSKAIEYIVNGPGIKMAEALADQFINKALDALDQLPEMKTRTQLKEIAIFVNKRTY